jgi:RimJ/RimL family protein N-acetyltransferase
MSGVYARSHLSWRGLGESGMRAFGCLAPPANGGPALAAAVVAHQGIAWSVWDTPDQAAALAATLPDLGIDLLSGPRPVVEPLLAHLRPPAVGEGDHCPFEELRPADLHPPPDGGPPARRATLDDMEPLIDFYIRGFYSLARLPTRAAWRARLTEQITHRTLYLIEQDGIVVSAAMSSAETPQAAMIGGVATVKDYRNHGLSARCVHGLCADLFARGIEQIGLFYLPANKPAARVYAKLGFQGAGEWWLQRLYYW